jgi:hypothetical protein
MVVGGERSDARLFGLDRAGDARIGAGRRGCQSAGEKGKDEDAKET